MDLAQRLVRKVCEHCKESYEATTEVVKEFKQVLGNMADHYMMPKEPDDKVIADDLKKVKGEKLTLFKGKGCDKCGNSGYSGRIGIFEVLNMNDKIAKLVLERKPASEIEALAISDGMITLLQDGYLKAVEGITTMEEVLRVERD